ncbi:MAG: hypothetical protein P8Y44_13815 [Acidobacteriota bacterium]
MEGKSYRFSDSQRSLMVILALSAITVSIVVWIAAERLSSDRLWGDEGTYVAMTESLVRDGDLTFGETDRDWAANPRAGGPTTVILQRTERGITYSKPVLYPLLAAPLHVLLGETGMVVTNLLLLTLALVLSWRHLTRMGHPIDALWVLATFSLCGALVPYVGWKMSDLALAALTLCGLILLLGPVQRREPLASHRSTVAGGVLLAMAVSMRYPTATFVAAVAGALLLHRKFRSTALFLTASVLTLVALNSLSAGLIGSANPYKSVRASFNGETGYPVAESDPSNQRFVSAVATQSATWVPTQLDRRTLYSGLYFFVGRHTGLLLYFPVALLLLLYGLRRPSRIGLMLLAAVGIISAFYLVWMPDNYFGGSTFLGPFTQVSRLCLDFGNPGVDLVTGIRSRDPRYRSGQSTSCSGRHFPPPSVRVDGSENRWRRRPLLGRGSGSIRRSLRRRGSLELSFGDRRSPCRATGCHRLARRLDAFCRLSVPSIGAIGDQRLVTSRDLFVFGFCSRSTRTDRIQTGTGLESSSLLVERRGPPL